MLFGATLFKLFLIGAVVAAPVFDPQSNAPPPVADGSVSSVPDKPEQPAAPASPVAPSPSPVSPKDPDTPHPVHPSPPISEPPAKPTFTGPTPTEAPGTTSQGSEDPTSTPSVPPPASSSPQSSPAAPSSVPSSLPQGTPSSPSQTPSLASSSSPSVTPSPASSPANPPPGTPSTPSSIQTTSSASPATSSPNSAPTSSPSQAPTTSTSTPSSTTTPSRTTQAPVSPTPTVGPDEIIQYLDGHNAIRAEHDADPLTWSIDLEAKALLWASQCQFQHTNGALGPLGENMVAGTGTFTAASAVAQFTDESYDPQNPTFNHLTQVVWKNTTELGCGVALCNGFFDPKFGPATFHVCFYNPVGNVIGQEQDNVQAVIAI